MNPNPVNMSHIHIGNNKIILRIRLHLRDFETECGWDHLYIWDGDNIFTGLQVR